MRKLIEDAKQRVENVEDGTAALNGILEQVQVQARALQQGFEKANR